MKIVILAGGHGTRLQEETQGLVPKPMVTIGGIPILVHIIKLFAAQGFDDFVIAGGFLWEMIRDWFQENVEKIPQGASVSVINTGQDTKTGGRIGRLRDYLWPANFGVGGTNAPSKPLPFIVTYGDGLADINFRMLIDHHARMSDLYDNLVTLTASNPPSRFGRLGVDEGLCSIYLEKGQDPDGWINSGFYVCDPMVLELINGDECVWEKDILPALALQGRLAAYQHPGEFQMMDTWRDRQYLEGLVERGDPFWERLIA